MSRHFSISDSFVASSALESGKRFSIDKTCIAVSISFLVSSSTFSAASTLIFSFCRFVALLSLGCDCVIFSVEGMLLSAISRWDATPFKLLLSSRRGTDTASVDTFVGRVSRSSVSSFRTLLQG